MSSSDLDEVDLKILEHLVTDARISQRALARSIGMSPPAISERISRLEAAGVIRGYRAIVDWNALRRPMLVDISVLFEKSANHREIAARLLQIPEVELVDIVTGSLDLRLRLRIQDLDHLRRVFFDELMEVAEIRHTNTSIVLSTLEPPNFTRSVLQQFLSQIDEEAAAP